MITAWMLYAVVVGILLSLAGLAAERALRLLRLPVRGVWAGVLLLSILVPLLGYRVPGKLPLPARLLPSIQTAPAARAEGVRPASPAVETPTVRLGAIPLAWGAASVGLLAFLLYSLGMLQGRRREWRRETVAGTEVLVARELGPAVVGWRRLEIVLPEWVLSLGARAQRLILEHELEHLRRRDPRLALAGWLPLLFLPWNPALWWQRKRLRRAIELDCDARVVRAGADPVEYGKVLLDVGSLCGTRGFALAAFAERSSDLAARIHALAARTARAGRMAATLAGAGAVLLLAGACLMPDPLAPGQEAALGRMFPFKRTADSTPLQEWLQSHPQAEAVVIIRKRDDQVLHRFAIGSWGEWRARYQLSPLYEVPARDIDNIEVLKGKSLQVRGVSTAINGVIFVTLTPEGATRFTQRLQHTSSNRLRE